MVPVWDLGVSQVCTSEIKYHCRQGCYTMNMDPLEQSNSHNQLKSPDTILGKNQCCRRQWSILWYAHTWKKPVSLPVVHCGHFYTVLSVAASKIRFLKLIGSPDHQAFSMYGCLLPPQIFGQFCPSPPQLLGIFTQFCPSHLKNWISGGVHISG